jgi:hypothetical protein
VDAAYSLGKRTDDLLETYTGSRKAAIAAIPF